MAFSAQADNIINNGTFATGPTTPVHLHIPLINRGDAPATARIIAAGMRPQQWPNEYGRDGQR